MTRAALATLMRDVFEREMLGVCAKFPALGAEVYVERRALKLRGKTGCAFRHAWSVAMQLIRGLRRPNPPADARAELMAAYLTAAGSRVYRPWPRRSFLN